MLLLVFFFSSLLILVFVVSWNSFSSSAACASWKQQQQQQMKQRKRQRRGVERDLLFLLLSFDKEAIIISFFFFFFFKWKMTCVSTSEHQGNRWDSSPPPVCLSKREETNKRKVFFIWPLFFSLSLALSFLRSLQDESLKAWCSLNGWCKIISEAQRKRERRAPFSRLRFCFFFAETHLKLGLYTLNQMPRFFFLPLFCWRNNRHKNIFTLEETLIFSALSLY